MTTLSWEPAARGLRCRACGYTGVVAGLLGFSAPGVDGPVTAVRCPVCDTVDLLAEIFDTDPTDEAIDAYLEVGAGIEVIASLIDSLGEGGGRRLLDVGAGFGFGVHYASRLGGWSSVGVEPSLAAVRGARELAVEIRTGRFGPRWSTERFDAILSSEVLEHVPDPGDFVRALAEHLAPSGQVVLTTPDPDVLDPASSEADIHSVLSAGYHYALYSRDAVETMFRDAGFGTVRIDRIGLSHRVRARLDDVEPLDEPPRSGAERAGYLAEVARTTTGSLGLGMATRSFRRAVAAGDWKTARRSRRTLRRAFRRRYGIDPARPARVDRAMAAGTVPGSLGGALFGLGMVELLDGSPARAVEFFDRSVRALEVRRELTLSDADSSDILEQARFHGLLALARTRPADAARRATDVLSSRAPGDPGSARLARVYVEIVARGELGDLDELEEQVGASAPVLAASPVSEHAITGRDALYSIGIRHLQLNAADRARPWLERARASAATGPQPSPDLVHAVDEALRDAPPAEVEISHYLDVYWCDPHGAFLEGWIHVGGEPGDLLQVDRDDVTVTATRHERADLEQFWPDAPRVRDSGFRVYVAGHPLPALDVVLTLGATQRRLSLELPGHRLPVAPADPDAEEMRRRLAEIAATAPEGPVLSIGARTAEADTAAFSDVAFARRTVVGFDIHPGFHVDIVGDAHRLSSVVERGAYPIIYTGSLLEHVSAPWLVAAEIARALPIGGVALHVVPWLWPTHSEPNDFWRFSDEGLKRLFGPELGFEYIDGGSVYPASAIPTPAWREINPAFATLTTPTTSWIAVRKVDARAEAVQWPYDDAEGREMAERYPLDGLARDPRRRE